MKQTTANVNDAFAFCKIPLHASRKCFELWVLIICKGTKIMFPESLYQKHGKLYSLKWSLSVKIELQSTSMQNIAECFVHRRKLSWNVYSYRGSSVSWWISSRRLTNTSTFALGLGDYLTGEKGCSWQFFFQNRLSCLWTRLDKSLNHCAFRCLVISNQTNALSWFSSLWLAGRCF